jgi:hypothetical protein
MNDLASTARDPRCRYCGLRRSVAVARLAARNMSPSPDRSVCPLDGHRLPPEPPDCRGCAGACTYCKGEIEPLPCPHCGFAG